MKGILCIQVGTPDSFAVRDVKRYLTEFLTDPCIIEKPWLLRQFLVRGVIVPTRAKQSSQNYQMIWQDGGSPLKIYTEKVAQKLEEYLGPDYKVCYAMGYQNPSISSQLQELLKMSLEELIIVPLFPQYAKATTGSVTRKVFDSLKKYRELPHIRILSSFDLHPEYLKALEMTLSPYRLENYDQVVFSFHSLPESVAGTYRERCISSAEALARRLDLTHYTVSFQSKLGRQVWIGPSTADVLAKGWKKVLVICPSFVADCVETIHEIGIEERHTFMERGGEVLDLVPCLNDSPYWVKALANIIL